jgi:hypothetical protein
MGESASRPGERVNLDPPAIREAMSKTRSALEQKLGELKNRFTNPFPVLTKGITTVAKKKKKAAPKSAKSSTGGKKAATPSRKKSAATGRKAGATVGKAMGKAARQAQDVLGDVLAGAAQGAMRGAAEVVEDKAKKVKARGKKKK